MEPGQRQENSVSSEDTVILPPEAVSPPVKVRVDFGARTHVGKVRRNNEDQFLIARLSKSLQVLQTSLTGDSLEVREEEGYLMLVADGMGGHAAGERASALVVEEVERYMVETAKWFFRETDQAGEEFRSREVARGLENLHRKILSESGADSSKVGMGTTLTTAISVGLDLFLVHVGDSRAYLFHEGQLEQLTHDHTIAQQLVDSGLMAPEAAGTSRLRHVLTNVLGGGARAVTGEIHRLVVSDGDRLLLCTDGLTEPLTEIEIVDLLRRFSDPDAACQALIDAVLERGAPDNVSVVLAAYTVIE